VSDFAFLTVRSTDRRCSPELAEVTPPQRAILKKALKIARDPSGVTDSDFQNLRDFGLSERRNYTQSSLIILLAGNPIPRATFFLKAPLAHELIVLSTPSLNRGRAPSSGDVVCVAIIG